MSNYAPLSSNSGASWREPDDPAGNLRVELDHTDDIFKLLKQIYKPVEDSVFAIRVPDKELVEEESESRNWKGILIAILVIVTVFSFVIVAIVLVTPDEVIPKKGDKFTLKEYLDGAYEPFVIHPLWSPDGHSLLYKSKDNEIIWLECKENISSTFLDNSSFRELNTDKFLLSADKSYIIFPYQSKMIYAHSGLTRYKLYSTDTRLYRDLDGPRGTDFQHVMWAHSGQGLFVAQENNIYFKRSFVNEDDPFMQITTSGEERRIYNGVPNWLYGEEILKSAGAMWLSRDDRYLVYATFNDTAVEQMPTIFYGDPKHKYTQATLQRYPKVGTPNPTFQLKVFSFKDNSTKLIKSPESLKDRDHYFTSVIWRDNSSFAVVWLSRSHNLSIITICDASEAICYENLRMETEYGWVEPPSQLIFTQSGNDYFVVLPRKDGENGLFDNVAMVDSTVDILRHKIIGKRLFVTVGQLEVAEVLFYDPENKTIYYLGIPPDDPKQRHLYYTTSDKDTADFRRPTCVTCDLGDHCKYVDAKFPTYGSFYILGCLGPDVPYFHLYAIPDIFITEMEENDDIRALLDTKLMPENEFVVIETEGESDLHAKITKPSALNKGEIYEYNLVLTTNEDLGTQHVTYQFDMGWDYFMSSVHKVVMARLDPRGTRGRGDAWFKAVYRSTGKLEVEDIVRTMKYFSSLHYVKDRVAILGKGYGGYLAMGALTSPANDVIQCGAALSPITDFKYIDSFFAEKYHTGWQSRINDYNNLKLSRHIKNLADFQLMILHGTSDDRIHFQHSAQYIKHLISSNIDHESKFFPDISDLMRDPKIRKHVLIDIENFFLKCFGQPRRQPTISDTVKQEDDEES